MARDREKFKYAVRLMFQEDFAEQAERDFIEFVDFLNERNSEDTQVKTIVKPRTGERKYGEFLIIVG